MKKIIRTNNLQKALEDYDALKGQAVSYVSELPESPNIRNSVYCKQTTTDVEDSLNITVESLIQDYAEETETADHYVIPVTYTVEYLGIAVRAIEVSGDVAIMYEDEEFTTALAATFNLEDKYLFAVTTHVTEMAYYMGDVTNQTLHPVVSFGVIAEVNKRIDVVERELDDKADVSVIVQLDNKIDSNYNTLDTKIDNSYNTLDTKIDNEISNLAVNFTTNNLVANVATINNATVNNATINNASVSSLNVAEIIANGSAGTNGQILGKVNGNLEWQNFSTDNFVVNNITVNKNAVADNASVNNLAVANIIANESVTDNTTINNMVVNNATLPRTVTTEVSYYETDGVTPASGMNFMMLKGQSGFGEPGITTTNENFQFLPFITMSESVYNELYVPNSFHDRIFGYAYKNVSSLPLAFIATAPFGNIYFAGKKIIEMNLIPNVDGIEITPNSETFTNSVVTPTLTFTTDSVTNNLSKVGVNVKVSSVFGSSYHKKNQVNLPYGINDNGSDITTNINNTQFASFDRLFDNKQSMTDCFITNPSLIVNAPSGYNVLNNVTSMSYTFNNCIVFNKPITIPDSVTSMYGTFTSCYRFNSPVIIGNGVTDMFETFCNCNKFNQPIVIPDSVTSMYQILCMYPGATGAFNSPVTIGKGITNMSGAFYGQPIFANSTVPIHISHEIALGNTSNYIYNMLVNNGVGIIIDPSRILNDA